MIDEARTLRRRIDDFERDLDRENNGVDEAAQRMLVQTTVISTYPVSARSVFACKPLRVSATEQEGSVPSTSTTAGKVLAANLGTGLPAQGTILEITKPAGSRWVFVFNG